MNPLLKQLLRTSGAVAKENLVEDAAAANQSDNTTDPEQTQKNVDFQAEIERLKNLQGDPTGGEGGDNPDGEDGDGSGTDPEPTNTDDPDAGATDPAPEDNAEDDPGNGDVSTDEEPEEKEGSDDEPKADGDGDPPKEDAEVATEALLVAAKALEGVYLAHEQGVLRNHHIALFETALESQYHAIGAVPARRISKEDEMPEGFSNKLKYAVGRVQEFLKQILAKMKEYSGKILNWIKSLMRGMAEARGVFESNLEGLAKRINYLKGKERPEEEIAELAKKNAYKTRSLSTAPKDAVTLASIDQGIQNLQSVGKGIWHSVTDTDTYAVLTDIFGDLNFQDIQGSIITSGEVLTPELMFDIQGATSAFGTNTHNFNATKWRASERENMLEFVIANQLGLTTYKWILGDAAPEDLDGIIRNNNQYLFTTKSDHADQEVPLLTSLDDCDKALGLVKNLMAEIEKFAGLNKILTSTEERFVRTEGTLKRIVDAVDMEDDIKVKVLMVQTTAQAAYTNIFIKSVTSYVSHLNATIKALQQWVAMSLNIIAPQKSAAK